MTDWMKMIEKEPKLLFVLALISAAMLLDLLTGLIAAKLTKQISSKIGINGILRKIASILLLLFFLPVSSLIPLQAGSLLLYAFYLSFLLMELHSILENYEKMGLKTEIFQRFLQQIFKQEKDE
ncbi:phage holin family protein [Enterococcus dongliensis]|uniref:Phage holin family protein n=2 Tax=Enterococcus dongliensis TaxID=2559925 RepID=A0AAP5NKG0_9ENTE|nr:phage holin family protein [Enterococcus dongliensis]MDT2595949.1 phage holin family protein [Enterococcus dongliensis]MDT2602790.1 phage holin family protein [Enterococcus dongliensis]MDT2634016.1 phage holin family protein [Enterococcus dongliensis]MDT2637222.1 phage holin family protein [Enterococcus dongliensis]MDT2639562.1 phage holin family protein [Enterococcus dongliensis]